jgi:hypothetical protein
MPFEVLNNLTIGETLPFNPSAAHSDYADMYDEWTKCRDCYAGEKQVKSKTTEYLPMLGGQTSTQYTNYLNRAQFYGATGRTVEAYLGMVFRKPVSFKAVYGREESVELDEFIYKFLDRISSDGKNINELAHQLIEEIIVTGRVGLLVDFPKMALDRGPLSVSDYERLGIRPVISLYPTETIINWYVVLEDGQELPILYVLHEPKEVFEENSIVATTVDSYRILYLENWENADLRKYKVITAGPNFPYHTGDTSLTVQDITYPINNGEYFKYIPFYVLSDQGLDYNRIRIPMISDLANVNLGHYRNSADHENELHFVSIKTMVFPGWDKSIHGDPHLGGAIAAPKDCIPVLLQPTSDSAIREEMILKEARMAVLGAERISQKQRYLPSASVAEITASAESSVIQNFLTSLNLAMNKILENMITWAQPLWPKYNEKHLAVKIHINEDLADNALTGADLVNFINAYQQGGISLDTLFYNLERREIYPEGWTKEQEWSALTKTQDLILGAAMEKIVNGGTANPFFSQQGDDSQEKQTASSGTGSDVTVRPIGTSARVRIS